MDSTSRPISITIAIVIAVEQAKVSIIVILEAVQDSTLHCIALFQNYRAHEMKGMFLPDICLAFHLKRV